MWEISRPRQLQRIGRLGGSSHRSPPKLPSSSERPRRLLLSLGANPVRKASVQIRHVLCFTAFRTHPGPEVGAIPARPGPLSSWSRAFLPRAWTGRNSLLGHFRVVCCHLFQSDTWPFSGRILAIVALPLFLARGSLSEPARNRQGGPTAEAKLQDTAHKERFLGKATQIAIAICKRFNCNFEHFIAAHSALRALPPAAANRQQVRS